MRTLEKIYAGLLFLPILFAAVLAWMIVIGRRAKLLFAMINQVYTGTPTSRRMVALPNVNQFNVAGQPILIGTTPAFTLDSYQANFGGCTVLENGSFSTTIIGRSANSPLVTAQVNPGDPLYVSPNTGTLDATTNVTYGFVLDKNIAGIPFGHYDETQVSIAAGISNTAGVVRI